MKLVKQNKSKILELQEEEFVENPIMVIAAHMDDNVTEEEKEEVRKYIQSIRNRRKEEQKGK